VATVLGDLLPCPFCGSEAVVTQEPDCWQAGCPTQKGCMHVCFVFGDTRMKAISAWNTRTPIGSEPSNTPGKPIDHEPARAVAKPIDHEEREASTSAVVVVYQKNGRYVAKARIGRANYRLTGRIGTVGEDGIAQALAAHIEEARCPERTQLSKGAPADKAEEAARGCGNASIYTLRLWGDPASKEGGAA
jgi:hypothetical protein